MVFPPTDDDLTSSDLKQNEAVNKTVDPNVPAAPSPEATQHDDWVTVEKPTAEPGPTETLMANKEDNQGSETYDEPKVTGNHAQNNLLKDW